MVSEDIEYVKFFQAKMTKETVFTKDLQKVLNVICHVKSNRKESLDCFFGKNDTEEILFLNSFRKSLKLFFKGKEQVSLRLTPKEQIRFLALSHSIIKLIDNIIYSIEDYQLFKIDLKTVLTENL